MRPIFIETMKTLFTVIHNKDACPSISDECPGVFIHLLFIFFPIFFLHFLSTPVIANNRLWLLCQTYSFKNKVVLRVFSLKDQSLYSVQLPRSIRNRNVICIIHFPISSSIIACCDMAMIVHYSSNLIGYIRPFRRF